MITLVGINHTIRQEKNLEEILYKSKPRAIGVELDEMNLRLLKKELSESEIKKYYSNMPGIFKLLSLYKDKSEKESSVDRMWDSRLIYRFSKTLPFDLIPLDMDKKKLFIELEKEITFSEKLRVFREVLKSLIFKSDKIEESDDYEDRFPTLKKYLIDKRNNYIAEQIKKIFNKYKEILVVVGVNHLKYLQNFKFNGELEIFDLTTNDIDKIYSGY